jgi:hypothetical protein
LRTKTEPVNKQLKYPYPTASKHANGFLRHLLKLQENPLERRKLQLPTQQITQLQHKKHTVKAQKQKQK